jgi:hypothetical protein
VELGVLRGKCLAISAGALRSRVHQEDQVDGIQELAFRSDPGFVCVRQADRVSGRPRRLVSLGVAMFLLDGRIQCLDLGKKILSPTLGTLSR